MGYRKYFCKERVESFIGKNPFVAKLAYDEDTKKHFAELSVEFVDEETGRAFFAKLKEVLATL